MPEILLERLESAIFGRDPFVQKLVLLPLRLRRDVDLVDIADREILRRRFSLVALMPRPDGPSVEQLKVFHLYVRAAPGQALDGQLYL